MPPEYPHHRAARRGARGPRLGHRYSRLKRALPDGSARFFDVRTTALLQTSSCANKFHHSCRSPSQCLHSLTAYWGQMINRGNSAPNATKGANMFFKRGLLAFVIVIGLLVLVGGAVQRRSWQQGCQAAQRGCGGPGDDGDGGSAQELVALPLRPAHVCHRAARRGAANSEPGAHRSPETERRPQPRASL